MMAMHRQSHTAPRTIHAVGCYGHALTTRTRTDWIAQQSLGDGGQGVICGVVAGLAGRSVECAASTERCCHVCRSPVGVLWDCCWVRTTCPALAAVKPSVQGLVASHTAASRAQRPTWLVPGMNLPLGSPRCFTEGGILPEHDGRPSGPCALGLSAVLALL